MKRYSFKIMVVLIAALALTDSLQLAAQQRIIQPIASTPMPQSLVYLPPPPDSLSMAFSNDVARYFEGKSIRDTERGMQAYYDVPYSIPEIINRMSAVVGVDINPDDTPECYQLIASAVTAVSNSCMAPKGYYKRRRPFDRFNELPYTAEKPENLKAQGSYPSAHSMLGWAGALLFSQLFPESSVQILRSGWEYGQSRVIIGVHWQSDVDAARMMTSACVARLLGSDAYLAQLELAKEELSGLTGQSPSLRVMDTLPIDAEFLPAPPDSASVLFGSDLTVHFAQKALRDTEVGQRAVDDSQMTADALCGIFGQVLHLTLNQETSPNIYRLIEEGIRQITAQADQAKTMFSRQRPSSMFSEMAATGEDIAALNQTSSYPSTHAAVGWMTAQLLMDVAPRLQDSLLVRGRDYGDSRVIVGANWPTDIEAGRLLAGVSIGQFMNDPDLRQLFYKAREEYWDLSGVESVKADDNADPPRFTLQGLPARDSDRGIIVSKNRKILIP